MLADDLMVSVGISDSPALPDAGENARGVQLDYWPGIVPRDTYDLALKSHWILVHTASHPAATLEHADQHQAGEAAQSQEAFCGWDKPVSFIRLELSLAYLGPVAAELGASQSAQLHVPRVFHARDDRVLQMSQWLLEVRNGGVGGRLYVHSLANTLALDILRRYNIASDLSPRSESSTLTSPEVARAVEYMQTFLNRDISLAELARAIHVSPSHLGRLFKRSTGMSPHQFLIRLRVTHARQLLLSGMRPIAEVALRSGFADQSHLTRHLKRMYGVTPKDVLDGR